MTFQNAYHGVKKIFTAELLTLIGVVCGLAAAVFGALTLVTAAVGSSGGAAASGIGTVVLFAAFWVLLIVGYIMNLVGLYQGGKDEDLLRTAFIISIFVLIIRFVTALFSIWNVGSAIADNITNSVSNVCEIIVVVLVVTGITNLAEKLHKSAVIGTGTKYLTIFVIAYGVAIIADLVVIFFGVNETVAAIEGILSIIHYLCRLVAYIVYLVFLGKAKKMLQEN